MQLHVRLHIVTVFEHIMHFLNVVILFIADACPKLPPLTNGNTRRFHSSRYGHSAIFTCNPGYKLSGASNIRCRRRQWTAPVPKCLALDKGKMGMYIKMPLVLFYMSNFLGVQCYVNGKTLCVSSFALDSAFEKVLCLHALGPKMLYFVVLGLYSEPKWCGRYLPNMNRFVDWLIRTEVIIRSLENRFL